ncbi:Na+/H+ antiporter [Terracoccus luteus]|uniref:CPA1 family monovalent cation:H+ antiporter n=1 Tax=Terracoccus luteus TaxID=53356 RepID=A0A495XZW1_9MICO|nr:Na+/H+ antiporter [Terracoccus luteus]MBB2985474.1 CPA1 family monovalent cation:H+ antiporter [Terracoccus luteus]MCP2171126.1 CPA1 family monovalent cation:H+ antiporter [Terracoccus luteus]RKT77268.1 sodium/proton antiporter (CPA1 family) [Terracoccus luteus]
MEIAIALLAVAATVLAGSWVAERLDLPAPLVLIVVGIAGSYLPFVPEVELTPELVLYGVLPPLLYAAAITTSLVDVRRNKLTIASLSVGLVLFTATGVGLFLWWLLGIDFALAFAVGAVVAPPDAVAATAVGRAIGLPRRLVTILEGESLLNDATALVSLRTALAAAGLSGAAAAGHVNVGSVALDFGWAVLGGVLVGVVVAAVVEVARRKLATNPTFDTVLSFMVPFAAYVPAEHIHSSGVIGVVTAGLVLGHRSPRSQPGASRLAERINWQSIQFVLENAVFLLIGLQVFYVIEKAGQDELSGGQITAAAVGTLLVVLVMRPLWVFPYRWLVTRVLRKEVHKPWTYQAVLSWAGMRGVVTLAGIQLIPEGTEHRETLILVAVVVTVGTLLVQGPTLPWLARRLGVRGPDVREDVLQAASVMQVAARAGLERLDAEPDLDESTRTLLRDRSADRVNQMWERLSLNSESDETPSDMYRRGRLEMLDAERTEVLRLRDEGRAESEVLRVVLAALDMEEMVLERIEYQAKRIGEEELLPRETVQSVCEHLQQAPSYVEPRTPEGCEECLRDGTQWVHLRLCLTCGHVGCCDSSEGKHGQAHYDESGHPVMRSFETGEAWKWCFVDEVVG